MTTDDLPLFAPSPAPGRQADSGAAAVLSVTELNRRARGAVEARFELCWVRGEIANAIRAASGHWYFSLRDDAAQVRCVLLRHKAQAIGFTPSNGALVDVRALPSLYEPRGEFQLGVETMRRAGAGALYEAFERLKARLQQEGLLDASRKRSLPAFPRTIGVVTSTQAAALRDVVTTLRRRAPMIRIVIYPTALQGAAAAAEIAAAIDAARQRNEVEALLICRGGGSMEDLWSFNDEGVARAIVRLQRETTIPVVSGVGHETDFTICDFVADLRAPTPTAGAELLSPDTAEWRIALQRRREQLRRAWQQSIALRQQRTDLAARGLVSPQQRLMRERERLVRQSSDLGRAMRQALAHARTMLDARTRLVQHARPDFDGAQQRIAGTHRALRRAAQDALAARHAAWQAAARALDHLAPERVVERGFAIVTLAGKVVTDPTQTRDADTLAIRIAKGSLAARVVKPRDDTSQ